MEIEAQSASPELAVFRTAFGLNLFFLAGSLPLIAPMAFFGPSVGPVWVSILVQVLVAAMVPYTAYLVLSTKYRVEDGALRIRMGPFKRSIAVGSITSVTDHGIAPGRVYGLGSDIMGLSYEGGAIDITPKDAEGFRTAIGFPSPVSADADAPGSPPGS